MKLDMNATPEEAAAFLGDFLGTASAEKLAGAIASLVIMRKALPRNIERLLLKALAIRLAARVLEPGFDTEES